MNRLCFKIITLNLCIMFSTVVSANDQIRSDAFITVGGSFSDSDVPFEGVRKDIGYNTLSRVGVQYTYKPKHPIPLTFTVQMLARGASEWDIEAEWALISYRPNQSWQINAGKIRTAFFMYSQYHDIGIAYPWVLPPEEMYGFFNVPFTSMAGFEIINQKFLGDWMLTSKIQSGANDFTVPALSLDIPVQMEWLHQIRFDITDDTLSFTLGASDIGFQSQELDVLANTPELLAQFGISDPAIMKSLAMNLGINNSTKGRAQFYDMGLKYDSNFTVLAEGIHRRVVNSTFPIVNSYYLLFGYHFNKWFPHLTISKSDTRSSLIQQEQDSVALGLNFNTSRQSVLKFEFKHSEIKDGSVSVGGFNVSNVGLYDTLPIEFGGAEIEDTANKISITFSTVL